MSERDERFIESSRPQTTIVCAERESVVIDNQEKARLAKIEAIERQLYYLIGQVRSLKTT